MFDKLQFVAVSAKLGHRLKRIERIRMPVTRPIAVAITLLLVYLPLPAIAQPESPHLFPIVEKGKWGFIDETGRTVIAPRFDSVDSFHDGLARVTEQGKVAFIDTSGKVVLRPDYQIVREFSEGLAAVN